MSVLGLTTAAPVLTDTGIAYLGFKDFVDATHDQAWLQYGRQLLGELEYPPIDAEESIAYLGASFADLVQQSGSEQVAWQQYRQLGRMAFLPLTVLRRVIDTLRPDFVLATNSPRAERAALLVAKECGLPSLCVADLVNTVYPDWLNEAGYGDKICVLAERKKQTLIERGRPTEEIVVTGNPAFDELSQRHPQAEVDAYRQQKGWQDHQIVLWAMCNEPQTHPLTDATSLYADLNVEILAQCRAYVDSHPKVKIILRPHPSQALAFDNLPANIEVDLRDVEIKLLLQSVDAVMTTVSTMGFEALYLDKPLVTVDLSVFTAYMSYSAMQLSIGAKQLTDIGKCLDQALGGAWTPPGSLPEAGQATKRVVEQVNQLLVACAANSASQ